MKIIRYIFLLMPPFYTSCGLYEMKEAKCKINCTDENSINAIETIRTPQAYNLTLENYENNWINNLKTDATIKLYPETNEEMVKILKTNPIKEINDFDNYSPYINIISQINSIKSELTNSKKYATETNLAQNIKNCFTDSLNTKSININNIYSLNSNYGLCIPFSSKNTTEQKFKIYDVILEISSNLLNSNNKFSDMLNIFPFNEHKIQDNNEINITLNRLINSEYEYIQNKQILANIKQWLYINLNNTNKPFSIKYKNNTNIINGSYSIINYAQTNYIDTTKKPYISTLYFILNFVDFSISHNSTAINNNFNFSNESILNGSYYIIINNLYIYEFIGKNKPCEMNLNHITYNDKNEPIRDSIGTIDLCQ